MDTKTAISIRKLQNRGFEKGDKVKMKENIIPRYGGESCKDSIGIAEHFFSPSAIIVSFPELQIQRWWVHPDDLELVECHE
jgi:hypothetical protein